MKAEAYASIKSIYRSDSLFDLRQRVGIIAGGGGKMGREFARTLSCAGATVVLSDIDREKVFSAAEELESICPNPVTAAVCDSTDSQQVERLFESVVSDHDGIDFIVYNVMAKPPGYYQTTEAYDLETWGNVIEGNLTGAFSFCRQAASVMKQCDGGSIVLTSSVYGLVGPDQRIYEGCLPAENIYGGKDPLNCPAAYSASKAGIIGLSRYFAALWGNVGIRVNSLVPGGVFDGQEPAFHDAYVLRTPLGRMAVWSDFNGAVLFLVSDASRYMTGGTLVIDGGWTAW